MVTKAYPFHAFKIQSVIGNSEGSSDCSSEGADVCNILSLKKKKEKRVNFMVNLWEENYYTKSTEGVLPFRP